MKICKICNFEKLLDDFYIKDRIKKRFSNICKICEQKKRKEKLDLVKNSNEWKEKRKIVSKKYYNKIKNNPDYSKKTKATSKEYYQKNKDNKEWKHKKKIANKNSYQKHKKKRLKSCKGYNKLNKDRINERYKTRLKSDPIFYLSHKIRNIINKHLKRNRANQSSIEILGCSFEYFKDYIESKFEPWMNWDNKGLYNGEYNFGWDIDHIVPLSTASELEDVIRLNHYTNLQPLCSKINREIKKDKLN